MKNLNKNGKMKAKIVLGLTLILISMLFAAFLIIAPEARDSNLQIVNSAASWKLISDNPNIESSIVANKIIVDSIKYDTTKCEYECKLKFGGIENKCLEWGKGCIKSGEKCLQYDCLKYDERGFECVEFSKECLEYDCLEYGEICILYDTQTEWQKCLDSCKIGAVPISENGISQEYSKDYIPKNLTSLVTVGFDLGDIYSYEKDVKVDYSKDNLNVSATLRKWNGKEFVTAPEDVFIDKNKFGGYDYKSKNTTKYQYTWVNSQVISFDGTRYILKSTPVFSSFFMTTQLVDYIDTSDICTFLANCTFNLNGTRLTVDFYAFYNPLTDSILIDPAYVETYTSSSSVYSTNRTEASSTGMRLTSTVLYFDFNSAPENNSGNVTYVKDNSIYNNWGTLQ